MFDYECEKPRGARSAPARRPLPPRPDCRTTPAPLPLLPAKPSVPLKVWIIASASCFSVCAALVLATVVITRWGASDTYPSREVYAEVPEPIYANPYLLPNTKPQIATAPQLKESEELDNDIQYPILEKLPIFKNVVGNRGKKNPSDNLASKPQLHPMHDTSLHHPEKKIEKKDHAVFDDFPKPKVFPLFKTDLQKTNPKILAGLHFDKDNVPEFKPTLPDVFINKHSEVKLADGYVAGLRKHDYYEDYYNDENLYDDYMQSNTMTSYLIEKVQELHDWITSDPDFGTVNATMKKNRTGSEFGQLLKALNESIIEGNVTIVMSKLKDIYFGENFTNTNHSRKVILSNSTDLLSFGILTLDVMLLHNIQLMAWENQETARNKMLLDPDVFAFNALFLEPSKVEARRTDLYHHDTHSTKRQNRQDSDVFDFGKNLLDNVLEIGMSTARAAIHLGRAYKNTKNLLSQVSNRETLNVDIQAQMSRNMDANTLALHHLQTSYNSTEVGATSSSGLYTELDCVWLLYCRNLAATAKLNAPYGTMARINGIALRMLTGELSAERALDTMLYEVLSGWTELRCSDMFPRCSKADAAAVVLDSIMQPLKKSQTSNRS